MRFHEVTIFAGKSFTPQFDTLSNIQDIILRIHSGEHNNPPKLTIFFSDLQEATNFKNAIISSWETLLRNKKEKS